MAGNRRRKSMRDATEEPFWQTKTLAQMSTSEWESLCDGCGRCCLSKLEDWDTGDIFFTDVACALFDSQSCRCRDYPNRHQRVADCIPLTPENVGEISWLPPTCAYRLLAEGEDLYWWHPLVSGDARTVHDAGISVRGRTISEDEVPESELEDHIVAWPGEVPSESAAPDRPRARTRQRRRK